MLKGNDNYISAYDYIKNQLLVYNYGDAEHRHLLRLKLWVLDGDVSNADVAGGMSDTDVENPKNHYADLMNEMWFFDRYVKTRDKEIQLGDLRYSEAVLERKHRKREFLRQYKDTKTREKFKDYEQPYSARPTRMSIDEVSELYDLYKEKQKAGELSSVEEIYIKPTRDNIDQQIHQQEQNISNAKSPGQISSEMRQQAIEEAAREDDTYVKEMIAAHEEMIEIIKSKEPEEPEPPPEKIDNPDYTGEGCVDENGDEIPKEIDNPISWDGEESFLVNVPTIRNSAVGGQHWGQIIEEGDYKVGGYRFVRRKKDGSSAFTGGSDIDIQGEKTGEVEWDVSSWYWAFYYVENDADAGTSTENIETLDADLTSLEQEQQDRYNVLASRWMAFNELRENEVMEMGTRVKIESLLSTQVPDLRPDYWKHLNDKKKQKEKTIEILKEKCLFGEFV